MKPAFSLSCLVYLFSAGCFAPSVDNGQLKCNPSGKSCPTGFHCALDNTCWKDGQDPGGPAVDMAQITPPPDLTMPEPPPDLTMPPPGSDLGIILKAHKGTSVMAGAVEAKSEHFKVIMSVGQSPGGNKTAASPGSRVKGGLVGATQGK